MDSLAQRGQSRRWPAKEVGQFSAPAKLTDNHAGAPANANESAGRPAAHNGLPRPVASSKLRAQLH